jgi:hypothetical protein
VGYDCETSVSNGESSSSLGVGEVVAQQPQEDNGTIDDGICKEITLTTSFMKETQLDHELMKALATPGYRPKATCSQSDLSKSNLLITSFETTQQQQQLNPFQMNFVNIYYM